MSAFFFELSATYVPAVHVLVALGLGIALGMALVALILSLMRAHRARSRKGLGSEDLDKIPLHLLPLAIGIMVDKQALLTGLALPSQRRVHGQN